jgi:hypothetical protein
MGKRLINATPTEACGRVFPSKGHAAWAQKLTLLEAAGKIGGLEFEPEFRLIVNGVLVGKYTPDARYFRLRDGKPCAEEYKGYRTAVYKLRRNVFVALFPDIQFIETDEFGSKEAVLR